MTVSTEPCPRSELVVVTGASSGIGAATARRLAARGFFVLAGVRRDVDAQALRNDGIEPVRLDVTDANDIAALVDRVDGDGEQRPLRALVNNAGIPVNAPVEVLPLHDWRRLFDVNLFGQIAVTQALLPALLRSRGTMVNVSSVGGKVALPTYGAYAGAKFALEAVSDALRREVTPFGVKVVVVQPGAVVTQMSSHGIDTANELAADMTPDQHTRYEDLGGAVTAQSAAFTSKGLPAERAAEVIDRAVTASRPRTRYSIGRDAAVLVALSRFLPDRLLDRIVARGLEPYRPTAASRGFAAPERAGT